MLLRSSSAFRGSEGLSLEKPDAIADPIAVDEALKSRSRRTLADACGSRRHYRRASRVLLSHPSGSRC
jgi:hypothetical protein